MPGILNLGAFYETAAVCGSNGSSCKNLANCPDGDCDDSIPVAPVCKYISGQDPDDPESSFIPGADLISTFSYAMQANYPSGSTTCTDIYRAGCMTAPCWYEKQQASSGDQGYARCECPTFYFSSTSLSQDNLDCDAGYGHVWE